MEIALMIEGQEGVGWDDWTALALAAEEHGYDALFRSDHYLSFGHERERGALDAWATLAALGPVTERVRLGTLVSPVTFRHPALLAKSALTADHTSGGRVEVGMGAGWFEREHRAYGFAFPSNHERWQMLEEQVEIVHRLLSHDDEEVTFEGRHYRLEACPPLPKPVQRPHPRLILGGAAGPRAAELAACFADEYNMNGQPVEEVAAGRERVQRAWVAAGREPDTLRFSYMAFTVVGATEHEMQSRARLLAGDGEDAAAFVKGKRASGAFAGTPEQVLEQLEEYAKAGVRRVMLQHLLHDDLDAVALIGTEIIPEAAAL